MGQSPVEPLLLHVSSFTIQIPANLSSLVAGMQRGVSLLGNQSILLSLLVSSKEWMGL